MTGVQTCALPISHHRRVVAVDASPETIALNRARAGGAHVEYVLADVFNWQPPAGSFDLVFFGFWLSHVPPARFEAFWNQVRSALRPGGRVFFVDSQLEQNSTALDHHLLDRSGVVTRKLNDGREFTIVKVFHEAADLERRLHTLGWEGRVRSTGQFFLYGEMRAAA